jgi:uncharacterized protein (TIRG00374 family)
MFLDRFLMAYRWKLLLLAKNIQLRFWQIVRLYFLGTFIGNFLPSSVAPDAVRVYYAAKGGARTSDIVSSVVVDRLLGIFSLCTVVLLSAMLVFFDRRELDFRILSLAIAMMAAVLAIFGCNRILDSIFAQRFFSVSEDNKIWVFLKNSYESFKEYRNSKNVLFKSLGLSFGVHVLSILSVYLLSLSINLHVPLFYFFLFVPLIVFLIMLPVSIGGIGVQEGAFIYLFTRVGVPSEHAFTVALLFRVMTLVVSLPGAYFYLMGEPSRLDTTLPVNTCPAPTTERIGAPGSYDGLSPSSRVGSSSSVCALL